MKTPVISVLAAAVLAACGGGGGGSITSGVTTAGVAAVGAPIVGGTVELKCASGTTATSTTSASGTWSVDLEEGDYPCAARVTGGTANGTPNTLALHSVALDSGTTNVTTLTDLMVASLAGQSPGAWFGSVSGNALSTAITDSTVANAKTALAATLATLPGAPSLPAGFNPLTTSFDAEVGDPFDALLETYSDALTNANITHSTAVGNAAAEQPLNSDVSYLTVFTYPVEDAVMTGTVTSVNDDDVITIPDERRGTQTGTVTAVDADDNATGISGDFTQIVSVAGGVAGQLCVSNDIDLKSRYVYIHNGAVEVTDLTELRGKTFTEYEDCVGDGTITVNDDGSVDFSYADGETGTDSAEEIAALFSDEGQVEADEISKAKAYKYTANGTTRYFYVNYGSHPTFVDDNTGDNYVILGVAN